ncbi:unnamed protein product [Mytilus coruscus]|uniref:Tesmin/TSO1-like CXC domain-containing protein n=1 Tax=Mytilus coruscus TaxID=42192 RepID=A0A6J8B9B0_MYTCO|nr:unnamed protein product [Mytilus coruscus]
MRSIKTTGRLTRGRGMSESQRALWILSMPDCAEVNNAMMSFTGTKFYSSDQHKEDGVSRQKRDTKDTMIFASFLQERNPFVEEEDSQILKELGEVFLKVSLVEDVTNAGEIIITFLYGGVPLEGLDVLSLRAYFKVQTWIGGEEIDPCDFGWLIVNGKLMPIKTTKQPAPQRLLSIIRCNCKTNCDNRRYTCRNISCGECRGQSCMNSRHVDINKEADELFSDSS